MPLCLLLLSSASDSRHIDIASKYLLVREATGHNDGPDIEEWQKFVNVPKGSPYCAAFVSWVLEKAGVSYPEVRSAVATKFIDKESIKATEVYDGRDTIDNTYLVIWRSGSTWKGHIGFVFSWRGKEGYTIEANTSPNTGDTRDGDGVYLKYRKIEPWKYFRIVAFTKIRYKEERWSELKSKIGTIYLWLL